MMNDLFHMLSINSEPLILMKKMKWMEIEEVILKQHLGTGKSDSMIQIYVRQLKINSQMMIEHNSDSSIGKETISL